MNLFRRLKINIYFIILAQIIKISPYLASKYLYKREVGEKLNLKEPRNFNEKIHWLKLYWKHPLISKCGDKFEVRKYVQEIKCSEILLDLYSVYSDASKIDWDILPSKFVLKVTNGCGYNIICENKDRINKSKAEKQLHKWMNTNYSLKHAEMHYSRMKPRIICEEYMETKDGSLPIDYKFFCFNGQPKLILCTSERATGVKRFMFDLDWNSIDFMKEDYKQDDENGGTIDKPIALEEMIYYAKILSKPFPFVRVDFYEYEGKPILGEMTFTPDAGLANRYKDDILMKMGDMIELPVKILS